MRTTTCGSTSSVLSWVANSACTDSRFMSASASSIEVTVSTVMGYSLRKSVNAQNAESLSSRYASSFATDRSTSDAAQRTREGTTNAVSMTQSPRGLDL